MRIVLLFFSFIFIVLSCKDQECASVINNRDPNGTSELQLTMRHMYDYFDEVKQQLEQGIPISEIKAFEHLLTDTPTEEGKNETDIYKAMAQNYLLAIENMNDKKSKEAFTQVVHTCMSCHQQICPGPMVKIKKLYLEDGTLDI